MRGPSMWNRWTPAMPIAGKAAGQANQPYLGSKLSEAEFTQ